MMEPASSSDDDSSSSTSSSSSEEIRDNARGDPEPVEDAASDGSDSGDDEEYGVRSVSNFDDLPTDDSEDESDSDDDSSVEKKHAAGGSDSEGSAVDEGVDAEDAPLGERVASRAQVGRRYYAGENATTNHRGGAALDDGGKRSRAERKSRALKLASVRLREARKEKGPNKKGNSNEDSLDSGPADESNDKKDPKEETKKKRSKHAPTEMSSKRRDYFARGRPDLNSSGIGVSIGANKYKARDPRMVSLSGHLDSDVFEKRYGFLEEVQDKEIERLRRRVDAWKKPGKKGQKERRRLGMTQGGCSPEDDREELTRLLQERAERHKDRAVRGAKRAVKRKIKEDVASGKRGAYYPKRSELKRMQAEAKFEEIRKRGGDEAVDKAIAKRRKKNLSKASKSMPSHKFS